MMRNKMLCNWMSLSGVGLLLLFATGCNTLASSKVSVLDQRYQCSANQVAGAELVSDPGSKPTDGTRIGMDRAKQGTDKTSGLEQFWVVRVNMGQQPSGGYALRLISEDLEVTSDTARVSLQWLQPDPGSVYIQALTYPCLYLKIAKGNYSRLEIVDQEGVVRYDLNLK